ADARAPSPDRSPVRSQTSRRCLAWLAVGPGHVDGLVGPAVDQGGIASCPGPFDGAVTQRASVVVDVYFLPRCLRGHTRRPRRATAWSLLEVIGPGLGPVAGRRCLDLRAAQECRRTRSAGTIRAVNGSVTSSSSSPVAIPRCW